MPKGVVADTWGSCHAGCITSLAEILVTVFALPQIGRGRDSKAEASPAGSALLVRLMNVS